MCFNIFNSLYITLIYRNMHYIHRQNTSIFYSFLRKVWLPNPLKILTFFYPVIISISFYFTKSAKVLTNLDQCQILISLWLIGINTLQFPSKVNFLSGSNCLRSELMTIQWVVWKSENSKDRVHGGMEWWYGSWMCVFQMSPPGMSRWKLLCHISAQIPAFLKP